MTEPHGLTDILVLLGAVILTVPVFQRLGFGAVLGYLFAGVLVGPWGLGFIREVEEIRHLAEFGVVFLLFIIGIELHPQRLWAMRRLVFGLGSAQVLLTAALITGLALWSGQSIDVALIIGFGLALSSTAFGLQLLGERGELGAVHGRAAFGILLLQDLAVVPLLALVGLLAADSALLEGLEFALLEGVLVIAFVIFASRFLLTPVLRLVATSRTSEVFTAAAVFAVLGTAWLVERAGMSLALGAFLAGLMLADSHYRHQIIADIQPFRGILLGLFFMGVGMSIDFGLLRDHWPLLLGLVTALLLLKSSVTWILARLLGLRAPDATRTALLLSQSGEFGFVLFGLAAASGLFTHTLFQFLTMLIALSMVTTPFMAQFATFLNRRLTKVRERHDVSIDHIGEDGPHVIIAGFGRVGRRIARMLQEADVPYLAVERDPDRVHAGRQSGFQVFYGDASLKDVLQAAGAGAAGALVCTLDEPVPAIRLVSILHEHYPALAVYTRGQDRQHCDELLAAGATVAVSETLESSLQLGSSVLCAMGVFEQEAQVLVDRYRAEYYR